ncbi:MAG: hypothetical protein JJE53_00380 [Candidatus Pacebacteria bacterium]|nr:hypothetical protein [Candidatus Paceibacterota bacterium]
MGSKVSIDRSDPFDPTTYIGKGWSILEQDERAVALTEIDLNCVMLDSTLEKGEKSIKGEDKLKRLKAKTNRIRLDVGVFKTLWENQTLIPSKWKEQTNRNTTYIFFDGTVLRNSSGSRYILCLYWYGGKWRWDHFWLGCDWNANSPSAVLPIDPLVSKTLAA